MMMILYLKSRIMIYAIYCSIKRFDDYEMKLLARSKIYGDNDVKKRLHYIADTRIMKGLNGPYLSVIKPRVCNSKLSSEKFRSVSWDPFIMVGARYIKEIDSIKQIMYMPSNLYCVPLS